jgi:catechol 2,3-dioxygenase-like lactoylglutathione lyase family enzyme
METYNVGNGHLCLTTDDIHGDVERLRGLALLRSEQAVEIPWGPFRGGFALYLRDPDGITIELLQPPPDGVNLEQAASEGAASA